MRPKFEVGEVVILDSKHRPECNGEYVVVDAMYGLWRNNTTKEIREGWTYKLNDGSKDPWGEPSLRKKHQPGELSFTDLMASLSSPKLITHQA